MKKLNRNLSIVLLLTTLIFASCSDDDVDPVVTVTADFENIDTGSEGFRNGSQKDGEARTAEQFGETVTIYTKDFESGRAAFPNTFTSGSFDSWSGWSVSSQTDNTTAGFGNQYSAFPGSGSGGSSNFGVAFGDTVYVSIEQGASIVSVDVANTTYAALSMQEGDSFSKKFGGADGSDPDFFKLTITGLEANGTQTGSVDFFLADYRSDNPADDYILSGWETVNLSNLGNARQLMFTLESTDVGSFGINTPLYFCVDNVITLQ